MKIYRIGKNYSADKLSKEARFGRESFNETINGISVKQKGMGIYGDFVVRASTEEGSKDNLIELPSHLFESPLYKLRFNTIAKDLIGKTVGEAMNILEHSFHEMHQGIQDIGGLGRH